MLQTYSLKEGNIEKGTEKGLPCCVTTKTRGQKGDQKKDLKHKGGISEDHSGENFS